MTYFHKSSIKAAEEIRRELNRRYVIREANLTDNEVDSLKKGFADALAKLRKSA